MKVKVGWLEDGIRAVFYRRLLGKLRTVVEAVFGKRRLLMIFQDGCEKDLTFNQIILMTVDMIPVTKYIF